MTVDYRQPPTRMVANEWLEWMAGHPHMGEAIDTARKEGADGALIGYAIGHWLQNERHDALAERFSRLLANSTLARPYLDTCPACDGSGECQPGRDPQNVRFCDRCHGTGSVLVSPTEEPV